jgi:hypothetical protein
MWKLSILLMMMMMMNIRRRIILRSFVRRYYSVVKHFKVFTRCSMGLSQRERHSVKSPLSCNAALPRVHCYVVRAVVEDDGVGGRYGVLPDGLEGGFKLIGTETSSIFVRRRLLFNIVFYCCCCCNIVVVVYTHIHI